MRWRGRERRIRKNPIVDDSWEPRNGRVEALVLFQREQPPVITATIIEETGEFEAIQTSIWYFVNYTI